MADLLTKLSNKYGCDKSDKNHNYTSWYNKYLGNDRHKEFNILEFGYGKGKSVKMWMEYFTKANLISVDNMRNPPPDKLIKRHLKSGRFEFVSSDQIDKERVLSVLKKYKDFYIIIDDASHKAEDQQYTFSFSFPFVVPGGWYIIEDLKCRRNPNEKFEIQANKTLQVLQQYFVSGKFFSRVLTPKENKYINDHIEWIQIYDKIAFIKKRG